MGRQGPYGPGTQEKVANTQRSIRSVLSLLSFEGIGSYLEAGDPAVPAPQVWTGARSLNSPSPTGPIAQLV